jgi:AraC-like DNA-binding protein
MTWTHLLNLIILLGALQGFIVCAMLLTGTSVKKDSRRYLAALLFLISLASLGIYLMNTGLRYYSPGWSVFAEVFPFIIVLPIGPLIYFFTLSFRSSQWKIKPQQYWHFAPFMIDLLPQLLVISYRINLLPGSERELYQFLEAYMTYLDIPRWLSVTFYLFLSLRFIQSESAKTKDDVIKHNWLHQFISLFLCFQGVWLIHLVPYVIPSLSTIWIEAVGWYPVYIPLAVLIYWLGIKGFIMTHERKFTLTAIDADRGEEILLLLRAAMLKDKLYLDSSLLLSKVALHIQVTPKKISASLNQREQKTFNEFVNEYRIEEFKLRVHNPKYNHLTLSGLALECGFNSQATFQRVFKAMEGVSPSAYSSGNRNKEGVMA